nr:SJCHGC05006 protein [Schistosoma japonicum]
MTHCKAIVETGYTNKSLLTLSRVFKALRYRNHSFKSNSQNDNVVHVPFRDSKLTHLLKPCLNGQAKFILIITISDEPNLIYPSIKALKFGQQAMQISLGQAPPTKSILTTWYRKR